MESGRGELFPGQLLLMDPTGLPVDLPGTHTTEPAFGLPATWVDQSLRDEASFRGYTVVDPGTVLTTHLTEVLKSHMAELLSYAETKKLLDDLPHDQKKLVDDLIPSQISVTGVQRVLQSLLSERVSIRDLPTILEGIAEAVGHTKNAMLITEHVRARLARQLCHQHLAPQGYLPIVALSPAWEQTFAEVARRPRRRTPARDGAVAACRPSSRPCANASMKPAAGGSIAGAADEPARAPLCALDHRTLPAADPGDVAERNPPLRASAHDGADLTHRAACHP